MLARDMNTVSVPPEEIRASPEARRAERSRPPLTTRDRQFIASLVSRGAPTVQIDRSAIDPAVRRWIPVVVPLLAVLICGCILAIWAIL